jgi:Bacterial Ig domain
MNLIKLLARTLFTISLISAGIAYAAPTVSITSPANNATFVAPASITINANAAASSGTVSKVDFYNGVTKIGTDTTSPYSFAWTNVAVGIYTVTAKATDSAGAVTTSAAIAVKVNANVAPTLSITAPANNAAFTAPAAITINANAADTDGTIAKVEFYNGTALLGTDTTSPYSFAWANVAVGTYALTTKATDDKGAVTTSTAVSVKVNANQAPTVSVTAPVNNATFTAPAAINITANAADADGTITKVDFYNGTTLLGTDTTSPYSYSWASVAAGTYSITAKATDNLGSVTTSAAMSVTVGTNKPPTVSITAPVNNAAFTAPAAINIAATAADTDGTIAKVEFYNGTALLNSDTTSPYGYSWANVAAGTYSITAKVTDNLGAIATSAAVSVTVGSNQAPAVSVTAPVNNATFTAPATVNITANATDADGIIAKVEFFNGTTLLGTATTSPYSYNWIGVGLGTYSIKAKATDNVGAATTSATTTIKVVGNQAPIIDFNEPVIDPAVPFAGPTDIKLGAIASDPDGTITKVEYSYQVMGFTDIYKIGEAFIAPYRVVWKNASGNSFSPNQQIKLSAVATDNSGAKTTATKSFSLTTNLDLAQISFQMQGLEFVDQAVYSSTQSLYPTILFSPFEGRDVQRAQIYANTTLLCEITDALELSKGRLTCNASIYPAGSYLINAKVTMTNGTTTSKAAGTIYVQATPVAGVTITKPSEGAKLWPGRLDIEGDVTLSAVALFKLYAGFGKCTGTTTSVLYEEKIIEIPATLVGSRFTATYSYDKSASLPPCVKAVVVGTDGKNSQDLRHTDFLKSSINFVNTPAIVYASTVELEVVAILPPPSATTRVEIAGVVAAFNGTSYKASVPLQIGANQITATAYDGATSIVSGGTNITYVASSDRVLDAYLGSSALNTALPVALSEIKVSGTINIAPETTVMIRDAQGTTRFAVIRAYGAFGETITAYPGYNEIVVTAYGPGGLSATRTLSFVNFALGDTPNVVITSPQSCSVISTQPTTVGISADTFGAFSQVRFKSNGTQIGAVNANPVASFSWTNVPKGNYLLTASFDQSGTPYTSTKVPLTVSGSVPSKVSIDSPGDNESYLTGEVVPINIFANAPGSKIVKLEIFDNAIKIGEIVPTTLAAQYLGTFTPPTLAAGKHVFSVKITDDASTVSTSVSVAIYVGDVAIDIVSPNPGQSFPSPATVRVEARVRVIAGKTIANVGFYQGSLFAVVNAPTVPNGSNYVAYLGPLSGSYKDLPLLIKATTAGGQTVNSPEVPFSVYSAASVAFQSPANASSLSEDTTTVSGKADLPENAAILVNGVVASRDYAGNWFANDVPLASNSNSIKVSYETPDAKADGPTITVNKNGSQPFKVSLVSQEEMDRVPFKLRIDQNYSGNPVAQINKVEVDLDGDGFPDVKIDKAALNLQSNGIEIELDIEPVPGIHTLLVKVYRADGSLYMAKQLKALVKSPIVEIRKVSNVFGELLTRLRANDVTNAMHLITGTTADIFRARFNSFGAALPLEVAKIGGVERIQFSDKTVELFVARKNPDNTVSGSGVTLVLSRGIWRIEGM